MPPRVESETVCPKCGTPRTAEQSACARCGLAQDRWASFDGSPTPDPILDAAFDELKASWDEVAAHDSFLSLARTTDRLDLAAARYRQIARTRPDDPHARRSLTQIVLLAAHQQATAPREGARAFRGLYVLGVIVAAALVGVVGLLLVRVLHR